MFDDKIEELLESLCDCETYFECDWHRRLRGADTRGEVNRRELQDEMEWELARGHFFYIHGYEMGDEPHPEMLDHPPHEEGVQ